jgi:hypothetical protein
VTKASWLPLGVAALGLCLPQRAAAVEYEIFIDVDDEEEINDLLLTDQISDTTYETLIELMRKGTDLDRASRDDLYALPNLTYEEVDRILAYRAEAGRIADPADLVVAGVLPQRKVAALAAFLVVPKLDDARGAVHGSLRYRMTYVAQDPRVPPMALQSRVTALGNLTAGVAALLDPRRLGDVSWDPNRTALVAEPDAVRPRLPKAFAQWDTDRWGIIVGSYRIGFGERLTFDDTRRYTPNGFYLDDAIVARYDLVRSCSESAGNELDDSPCSDGDLRVAPNFQVSPGLRGVAAGAKKLPLAVGWLQAYGFWSMHPYDMYQYRVYDSVACQDPNREDVACDAPDVYKAQDDPLAPTTTYVYRSLPNIVDVITQGANLAWFRNDRTRVGVTGYGSLPRWRIDGANLDFQPSDRLPRSGAFGAVGADFSWGHRWADLFGEVSRSFDGVPQAQQGGGGFAGILRHTASWNDQELEVSLRYYDTRYANPYSRPISSRDRYEGNQARDEAGARVRYNAELGKRVDLRTFADFWVRPSTLTPRLLTYARADAQATAWLRPGLWFSYQSQDLTRSSFKQCTADDMLTPAVDDLSTEIICGGQRFQVALRSRFQVVKRLHLTLQYRHDIQNSAFGDSESSRGNSIDGDDVDVETFDPNSVLDQLQFTRRNSLRHDINAFLLVVAQPTDALRLRARVRWYWDDIADNARLEHSVWAYLEARYEIRRWAIPSLRYDVYTYLDRRDSTLVRRPNPEHWIRFQFESRF